MLVSPQVVSLPEMIETLVVLLFRTAHGPCEDSCRQRHENEESSLVFSEQMTRR